MVSAVTEKVLDLSAGVAATTMTAKATTARAERYFFNSLTPFCEFLPGEAGMEGVVRTP